MQANNQARELSSKLFSLIDEFKQFAIRCGNTDYDALMQADAVSCELARVYQSISGPAAEHDLFIDWARDEKDQSFASDLWEPA